MIWRKKCWFLRKNRDHVLFYFSSLWNAIMHKKFPWNQLYSDLIKTLIWRKRCWFFYKNCDRVLWYVLFPHYENIQKNISSNQLSLVKLKTVTFTKFLPNYAHLHICSLFFWWIDLTEKGSTTHYDISKLIWRKNLLYLFLWFMDSRRFQTRLHYFTVLVN